MSYFAPYVDGTGLHLPTYNDILSDLISGMKEIYGSDIYLGNDSADYQFLSILALKIHDSYQAVQYAYNSRSPATAIGAALDSVVKLNGIFRKPAGYSTCELTLTGTPFTEIKNGAVKDATGNIWSLPESVIIGSAGTVKSTATCTTQGAVTALPGDITEIDTPTFGWTEVSNEVSAIPGNAIETDGELRKRQTISVSNPSQTMLSGTLGAIRALENVTRVSVYENDTNIATVDAENNPFGLPPHSVTCVVEGGNDEDIAKAILYHKGLGCYTNGSKVVKIKDQNEYVNTVRFFRPAYVPIFVHVKLKQYTGHVESLVITIKDAVYNYLSGLDIGQTVSTSMLAGIIVSCNPEPTKPVFGIESILVGREEDSLGARDVGISYNEVASAVYKDIEVEI